MAGINGSSSSYLSSGSNGFSGLISGLDTEDMVNKLLSGQQSKIDKQEGLKQQLTWKQDIYRDLIKSFQSFQNTFFSFSNPTTNLLSQSFFNASTSISSNTSLVKVTAGGNAQSGKITINSVKQLATSAKKSSADKVSTDINLKLDIDKITDGNLVIEANGKKVTIGLNGSNQADVIKNLNSSLQSEFGGQLSASVDKDGKFVIKNEKGMSVDLDGSSSKALDALGLENPPSSVGGVVTGKNKPDFSKVPPSTTISVNLDGNRITVDLKGGTESEVFANLNNDLKKAFGSSVTVDATTGKIKVDGQRQLTITSSDDGAKALGIKSGVSNKMNLNQKLGDINFVNGLQGDTFSFKINGKEFNFSTEDKLGDVINEINSSDAGVKVTYSTLDDKFYIESQKVGSGFDIEMSQSTGNLLTSLFGVKSGSGVTNSASTGSSVVSAVAPSFTGVKEGVIELSVNGENFKVTIDKKADGSDYKKDEVIKIVNDALSNKFGTNTVGEPNVFFKHTNGQTSINTSPGYNVTVKDAAAGSVMDKLGFTTGQTNAVQGSTTLSSMGITGATTITVNVNGTDNVINMDGSTTVDDLMNELKNHNLNVEIKDGRISIVANSGNAISIKAGNSEGSGMLDSIFGSSEIGFNNFASDVKISSDIKVAGTDLINAIPGLTGVTGSINIKVSGIDVSIDPTKSVTDTISDINNTLAGSGLSASLDGDKIVFSDALGNDLRIEGTNADGEAFVNTVFGSPSVSFDGTDLIHKGQNAIFTVNGVEMEKNTNDFTIDGLQIELKKTFAEADAVDVETNRNTDQIFDGIVKFVDEYNKLIDKVNKLLIEETNYKKYPPLTSAQRADMSESEIKLWEEKAKEGLVKNDPVLDQALNLMRNALYNKPEGSKLALYQIGIETSSSYSDKGKLLIDETKLKEALAQNPDEVRVLFTDAKDGISSAMNGIIDSFASASTSAPGKLVQIAGTSTTIKDTTSTMAKELKRIENQIERLTRSYTMQKDRYWKQFNNMESVVSKFNSQSAWLSQQFM